MPDEWTIERRLGRLAWRPRLRSELADVDPIDVATNVDDLGTLALVPVLIVLVLVGIVVVPVVFFVLEAAAVLLLVVPLVLLALAVGLRRHELVARNERSGEIVRRPVRGLIASYRLKRRWRREIAESGAPREPSLTAR